jgi:hypothetical protein
LGQAKVANIVAAAPPGSDHGAPGAPLAGRIAMTTAIDGR